MKTLNRRLARLEEALEGPAGHRRIEFVEIVIPTGCEMPGPETLPADTAGLKWSYVYESEIANEHPHTTPA